MCLDSNLNHEGIPKIKRQIRLMFRLEASQVIFVGLRREHMLFEKVVKLIQQVSMLTTATIKCEFATNLFINAVVFKKCSVHFILPLCRTP